MHPDLAARVAALESQLRRWHLTTALLALVFAIVVLAAFQVPNPRRPFPGDPGSMVQLTPSRIASHSFVLVGPNGTVYARLTAQNGVASHGFLRCSGTRHLVRTPARRSRSGDRSTQLRAAGQLRAAQMNSAPRKSAHF